MVTTLKFNFLSFLTKSQLTLSSSKSSLRGQTIARCPVGNRNALHTGREKQTVFWLVGHSLSQTLRQQ